MKIEDKLEDRVFNQENKINLFPIAGNEAFFYDNYGNLIMVYINFGNSDMLGYGVLGFYAFTQNQIMLLYDAQIEKVLNREVNHKINKNSLETEIRRKESNGYVDPRNYLLLNKLLKARGYEVSRQESGDCWNEPIMTQQFFPELGSER